MGNTGEVVSHIPNLNVFADFSSKNTPSRSWDNNANQMMFVSDWMSSICYWRSMYQMYKMVELGG
jgi:hypothetical protein